MKTQISKPARKRASYTEQYKQEALELWRASGRSAAKVATGLPSWAFAGRSSTAGRAWSDCLRRTRAGASHAATWKNWRRRTDIYGPRTANSWSSTKCLKNH